MPNQISAKYFRPMLFRLQNISIFIGILLKVLFLPKKKVILNKNFQNSFWFQMDALCSI